MKELVPMATQGVKKNNTEKIWILQESCKCENLKFHSGKLPARKFHNFWGGKNTLKTGMFIIIIFLPKTKQNQDLVVKSTSNELIYVICHKSFQPIKKTPLIHTDL